MGNIHAPPTARLLRGTISKLRQRRGSSDFLFSDEQKSKLSLAVLADFISGNDGIGASLASMSDITTERADILNFELDGKSVQVCVWASNFVEGDEVCVVAENIQGKWTGYAIHRPADGLTAVYPHCTRGMFAHVKACMMWTFIVAFISYAFLMIVVYPTTDSWAEVVSFGMMAAPVALGLTSLFAIRGAWKFNKIVRMAERIFTTFGWPNPKWVDLRSGVKKRKREGDPPSFGVSLFRYFPKK